ncbi:MAG: hypothetical protein HC859_01110 [Bacteroidia bacterium]|nr:hypothetical protein [Bacteroidia bacterium]
MFVGGALQFQQWAARRQWVAYPALLLILLGIPGIPFGMPILPVDTYTKYAAAAGLQPGGAEGKALSDLPQFYADMFGWEDKAKAIADAYHSLSPEDQRHCVLFGDNYGRAGAIDYYAEKYDIPKAIGNHNNYWLWGRADTTVRSCLRSVKKWAIKPNYSTK